MQYLYKIINSMTNKFYVGRTRKPQQRWKEHVRLLEEGRHHSIHFQRAWHKYGKQNFKFQIIEVFNTGDEERDLTLAEEREQLLINEYMKKKQLYNRSWSSKTGLLKGKNHHHYNKSPKEWMSAEGYQNLIDVLKSRTGAKNTFYGKKHSDETIEILRKKCAMYGEDNPFYGKKHTQEAKAKMRKAKMGCYEGEKNPFYGKKHSEETKRILSEKNKGRLKGVPKSEEQKRKMREGSPKNRPVEVDGVKYMSLMDASRILGIDRKTITYRVNSQSERFKTYKFVD